MTVSEALEIVTAIVDDPKVEDEGVTEQGRLSADEVNGIVVLLNSLLTIGGHSNVDSTADNTALNDWVLYKKALTSDWIPTKVSSIRQTVESTVKSGSSNPVSSNAVYVAVTELTELIEACATADELTEALESISALETEVESITDTIQRVIDGGSARTLKLQLAARTIDCGTASDLNS